jgi:uncharacterized protein YndB with AHSA1/START domain
MFQIEEGRRINTEVIFTRVFNAPVNVVFHACANEKYVAAWWGPYGFTNPVCRWNAEVNGVIHVDMTSADGMIFPMVGIFHEIEFPTKLVFTTKAFEDEYGNAQLIVLNTLHFLPADEHTKFTLIIKVMKATPIVKESLDGMQEGWSQSLDKLEALLPECSKRD